jgi:hypothetical protein
MVVFLLITQLTGVSWLGLQGISKAIQTNRNAQRNGILVALKQLPHGNGNCGMCRKIRQAKTEQNQQQRIHNTASSWMLVLIPSLLPDTTLPISPLQDDGRTTDALFAWRARTDAPPVPPPRA